MKRILLAAALVSLVVIGIVAAFVVSRVRADHNVRGSSTVEFVPTLAPEPPAPAEPTIAWPTYGYDNERIRVGPSTAVEPPFTRTWMFRARALVEFPPAIAYGRLYFANGIGRVLAVDAGRASKSGGVIRAAARRRRRPSTGISSTSRSCAAARRAGAA